MVTKKTLFISNFSIEPLRNRCSCCTNICPPDLRWLVGCNIGGGYGTLWTSINKEISKSQMKRLEYVRSKPRPVGLFCLTLTDNWMSVATTVYTLSAVTSRTMAKKSKLEGRCRHGSNVRGRTHMFYKSNRGAKRHLMMSIFPTIIQDILLNHSDTASLCPMPLGLVKGLAGGDVEKGSSPQLQPFIQPLPRSTYLFHSKKRDKTSV